MSRFYCYDEREHEDQGASDFRYRHRPDYDRDRYGGDACDEAYFRGYRNAERRDEERREEERQEEARQQRRHEAAQNERREHERQEYEYEQRREEEQGYPEDAQWLGEIAERCVWLLRMIGMMPLEPQP